MNKDKILKNATLAGADLSAFHEPDRKWKNYYIEDEENDLLFLVPSYLFYGVIVLDLSAIIELSKTVFLPHFVLLSTTAVFG